LSGPFTSTLLRFALPIILGNLLQHLYSLVDAIVVGQYLGDLPLAGISVAAPMMDIVTALLIGGTIGMGVLVGQQVGAGDWEKLRATLSTSLIGGLVITVALGILGIAVGRPVLLAQGAVPAGGGKSGFLPGVDLVIDLRDPRSILHNGASECQHR